MDEYTRSWKMRPFEKPVYLTRPILPDLDLVRAKLEEIWEAQWLTNNGAQHRALEKALCNVLKTPYLSLFNNGTIALIVAMQSLNLKGEVITTPFTFPATPHVLSWNGIKPVFCDIEEDSMNIDPEKIEELITPETSAILGVHVFGTPCNVRRIQEIADRHSLKVVYDAAHAFNTEIDGAGIGSFGDISMFSFHATKLFHTLEGGALVFKDAELKKKIDLLKNFGIKNEEEVILPGINGKMNEVQAAIGLINLQYIEAERGNRFRVTGNYMEYLKGIAGISHYVLPENVNNSCQYFVVRINAEEYGLSRDEVYMKFREYNVLTRKYFYPLCSDYDCYRQLPSADPLKLPAAQKVVGEVLCLPLYGALETEKVEKICGLLRNKFSSVYSMAV
jgi:dTDP-4-amino-4,6-dideoxygalactose transaminase